MDAAGNVITLLKQKPTQRVDDDGACDLAMLRSIPSFSSLLFRQLFLMLFTRVVVFSPVQNIVGPPSAAAVQQTQGSESDRGGVPVLYRCLPGMAAMNGGSELTAKSPSGWPLHPKKHSN